MTFPINRPHRRRFADPSSRPSNSAASRYDYPTRARVAELALWLDWLNMLAEAERALKGGRPTLGDPGE
jgi:hypothetical protein